ncbi:FCD domain-containing protein [Falsiroseomonas selenitidurans]|uniref:FCD domain-containing protein n=1 Tax=Falsiroseomonas selenitidurans TaxID=2716335 RepID=A0ABX1E878_9PROT|nr:FCD domain-containing protein [Falsiroseomonas selenitidurans]NKC31717.1 FCD domain-containing protein [Falsiroseomonas selenitidurans]
MEDENPPVVAPTMPEPRLVEPTALEIVRTRSLASLVAQEIEAMILAGTLAAGERLNEQQLAVRLGVSRGPVREAVRGLERSGLVVSVRNQGSYVRSVSTAEALEIYDLRAALTGLACARLAGTASAADRAALEALVARMDQARRADDAPAYYGLNLDFHAALLARGGGPRTRRLYEDLGNELHLFRRRALVEPENMRESNAEHAGIVAAIAAGDAAAARAAGEAHIAGGKRRFQSTDASATHAGPTHAPDSAARDPGPPPAKAPAAPGGRPRRAARSATN